MKKIAFYDTKPYDKVWFDKLNNNRYELKYFENRLNPDTAKLAEGCDGVIAFVNDNINKEVVDILYKNGIHVIAMRCAGYNNIDFKAAYKKITILRVPAYSPYAVAEHTMGMLLTLNRKLHKAYNRTRDYNFSLNGLIGFDLHDKTIGVIGTGKIGQIFINICKGFGMNVLAYDTHPNENLNVKYVQLDELLKNSDIISLHCPLTPETHHLINETTIKKMKDGVYILNTSRGALIDASALVEGLRTKKIGAAGLDVYEEEAEWFFEDCSSSMIDDDVLQLLVSFPNVLVTSHQAFLTNEALANIAKVTFENLDDYFSGKALKNEICYHCNGEGITQNCPKNLHGRCF